MFAGIDPYSKYNDVSIALLANLKIKNKPSLLRGELSGIPETEF